MVNKSTAYLLWLFCIFGICGVQRFYCGKIASGFLWLFTFGLFGFGQLVDLALIPVMVDEKNFKYLALRGGYQNNAQTLVVNPSKPTPQANFQNDVVTILRLAQNKGGSISVADVIIETGKSSQEVRTILEKICADGLMEIGNHTDTGTIIYRLL